MITDARAIARSLKEPERFEVVFDRHFATSTDICAGWWDRVPDDRHELMFDPATSDVLEAAQVQVALGVIPVSAPARYCTTSRTWTGASSTRSRIFQGAGGCPFADPRR